jgi:GntR family transcriptional regulator
MSMGGDDLMGVQTQEPLVTTLMTYRQIADDIIARIDAGEYQPGDRLPSYRDLAKLYSVGVSTASRAYGVLHVLGVITGEHGRGVYVAERNT